MTEINHAVKKRISNASHIENRIIKYKSKLFYFCGRAKDYTVTVVETQRVTCPECKRLLKELK